MKKMSTILLCFALILGTTSVFAEIKNPDTFIKATYGTERTLDPSVAYDTTSSQRLHNIYDNLIRFDGESTEKFVPQLAVEVPSVENGGISADGMTYTFKIREGVKFHGGETLTAEDVEYSFERNMVVDPDGGPMWMMLEALTGEGSTRDADGKLIPGIFEKIMNAVEVDGNTVVLHLPMPYPPLMGILSQSWAAIFPKSWAIANGCWDGTLENAEKVNNPAPGHEPLIEKVNGTGPYKLKSWEQSKEFVFERFEEYWGEKPALKYAIVKYVPEWSTRKLMLLNGDVDTASVDDPYVPEMLEVEGLKSYKVPQLSVSAAMFCQKVNPDQNTSIGSGKLDGQGIPPDFFSDINVRKAFMHAFDRGLYESDVLQNISTVPTNPNIPGLPYAIDVPVYEFDLEKAAEYMKKAWNGEAWEKGFKMTITYNTGNARREGAAIMLAENIMSLNPKFQVEVANVEWKDYLVKYRNFQYPIYIIGWGADYPDPHNFLYTFMKSTGVYGRYMAYKNPEVDELCDKGIATSVPEERAKIYARLQNLWYEDAVGLCIYQENLYRFYKDWVQGFVPHPMDGDAAEWFYRLSKEEKK
ncbi:extracellular solute-binding protein family 5 [Candidatus Vecturithrix granuli]|uniref:Extracellular solute-binding protein family 5 n=1 Tax=Vecturithrix granuli TaxID=1499967 RepID=A0A081C844_VECG1|nr:extracellular solute-binding protein family 5 [Candidatus Vecturithrix granuli]